MSSAWSNPWLWPLGLHLLLVAVALVLHLVHDRDGLWFHWGFLSLCGAACFGGNFFVQARFWPRRVRAAAALALCYLGGFFFFALLSQQDYIGGDLIWVDRILLIVFYPISEFVNSQM